MARLRRLGPDGTSAAGEWEIGDGLTLGRAPDCDVVLEDGQASRHHARVRVYGQGCLVEDAGSANGVFVGEKRITQATLAPGQSFRIGATWFVLAGEDGGATPAPASSGPAASVPAAAPHAPPARANRLLLGCALAGCLVCAGLVLAAAAGWYLWSQGAGPAAAGVLPSSAAGGPARGGAAVASPARPRSVPLTEADVLRFTLRVGANPAPGDCSPMPAAWQPPLVQIPLAARVRKDGRFRFEREWTDASGSHSVEGQGTWQDGVLGVEGRWRSRRPAGSTTQEDEGSFAAAGRQVLGAWFGDRIEGEFSSRLGHASCRETVANGYSRVDELVW